MKNKLLNLLSNVKMKKLLTTIYSQPSVESAKKLINCAIDLLVPNGTTVNADTMFYYGVFCSSSTYANYDWLKLIESELPFGLPFEVPFNLYSSCSTSDERINYVESVIKDVLMGNITKPEWMIFIEMESNCGCCEVQPSNFLRLLPKEEKYEEFGQRLIDFLYSPNKTTVVY